MQGPDASPVPSESWLAVVSGPWELTRLTAKSSTHVETVSPVSFCLIP